MMDLEISPADLWRDESYPFAIGHAADLYKGGCRTASGAVRKVAIKDLRWVPISATSRDEMRESLRILAFVWTKLRHPNIVPFLGLAFHFTHIASLVSPFYSNGTVINYLKFNPNADRMQLITDVSAGLLYLHTFTPPVVHADLKGSNVLVTEGGTACLVDFGLIEFTREADFTSTSLAGPVRYQSPEILAFTGSGLPPFTTRSDVYAFAMVSLEIITERPPFMNRRQDTPVIFDVIEGRRPSKPENNLFAHRLWPIINECWSQDPEKRPDMSHVHTYLESLFRT